MTTAIYPNAEESLKILTAWSDNRDKLDPLFHIYFTDLCKHMPLVGESGTKGIWEEIEESCSGNTRLYFQYFLTEYVFSAGEGVEQFKHALKKLGVEAFKEAFLTEEDNKITVEEYESRKLKERNERIKMVFLRGYTEARRASIVALLSREDLVKLAKHMPRSITPDKDMYAVIHTDTTPMDDELFRLFVTKVLLMEEFAMAEFFDALMKEHMGKVRNVIFSSK